MRLLWSVFQWVYKFNNFRLSNVSNSQLLKLFLSHYLSWMQHLCSIFPQWNNLAVWVLFNPVLLFLCEFNNVWPVRLEFSFLSQLYEWKLLIMCPLKLHYLLLSHILSRVWSLQQLWFRSDECQCQQMRSLQRKLYMWRLYFSLEQHHSTMYSSLRRWFRSIRRTMRRWEHSFRRWVLFILHGGNLLHLHQWTQLLQSNSSNTRLIYFNRKRWMQLF